MIEITFILFGLIIGSFLNVLIYRLPLGISIINPMFSACCTCKTTIKWYENIPVLSYIILQAKCSNCKEKISIVYPIVEVLTSFISLLVLNKFGINVNAFIILALFYTLIVLSFIDFEYKAVPDYLLLLILILSLFIEGVNYMSMLTFAGGFILLDFILTFYIQNIKAKIMGNDDLLDQKALGEGDIPIVAIIGGLLTLKLAIVAVFIASITALIPSLYNMIKKDDIETPFIPFLVLGFLIAYIFDDKILLLMDKF